MKFIKTLILLFAGVNSWAVFTGTPSGTVLSNPAKSLATFFGSQYEFESTVESLTVGSIYGLSGFNDPDDEMAYPGGVVRFSYEITNMGNDADDSAKVWISKPISSSGKDWNAWIEINGVNVGTDYTIPVLYFGAGAVFKFDVALEVPTNAVQDEWAYVEVYAETISNASHIVGVYTGFNGYIYGGKDRVDDSGPSGLDPGDGAHSCVVVVPPNRVMEVKVSDGVEEKNITHSPATIRRLPQRLAVELRDAPSDKVFAWLGFDSPTDGNGLSNTEDVRIEMHKLNGWWVAEVPLRLISRVNRVYVAFEVDGVFYSEGWNYYVRDVYYQENFQTVIMNNVIRKGEKVFIAVPTGGGGEIRVEFYSIAGEKVKSETVNAEPNSKVVFEWDGIDDEGQRVSAGIYFAVIKTQEFEEVRQVAVVE